MTYATLSSSALQGASLWQRLGDLRARLAAQAAERRTYRATLAELQGLGDRDLADIGLHRGQIQEVAREATVRA